MDFKNLLKTDLKVGKDSFPTKQTMNFIVDNSKKNKRISIVVFIAFIIGLGAFTKFGVIDTLNKTAQLESNYNSYQTQISGLNVQLSDYSEVEEKYNAMVGSYLNEDESSSVYQSDIIDMIDEDILPTVALTNYTITGNEVMVYTGVTDLATVSKVVSTLQADERVEYVTISRTLADSTDTSKVTADISITYNLNGGDQ